VKATEVKFSAGGDKISTRYDVEPDLAKIKEQVGSVAGVTMRASATTRRS
jgi:preprotein translocase subunit SecF